MQNTEFSRARVSAGLTVKEAASVLGYTERHISRFENGYSTPRTSTLDLLRTKNKSPKEGLEEFTFIDLFSGIGGLRLAFESIGGKCIFSSETDKFAVQTYSVNFADDYPISGDITQIESKDIPDHDMLLAGFPCQPFSIAGVSKKKSLGREHGFAAETQGTLFFDIARIIQAKRPKIFLLENVKNLQSHDQGRTFKVILDVLQKQLGYYVEHKVIDAQHFLPQHRERIVIIGFREDVGFSWSNLELPPKGKQKLVSILHPENGSENPENMFTYGESGAVSDKYTLTDNLWAYLQEYARKHKAKGNGFGFRLFGKNDIAGTLSARYYKDGAEILIDQNSGKNPRRLTPRECARLMGFDDSFRIVTSDLQAYRQFGNSVAVPVFKEVARIMNPYIFSLVNRRMAYQSPLPIMDIAQIG